jgi:hypothetical protein
LISVNDAQSANAAAPIFVTRRPPIFSGTTASVAVLSSKPVIVALNPSVS